MISRRGQMQGRASEAQLALPLPGSTSAIYVAGIVALFACNSGNRDTQATSSSVANEPVTVKPLVNTVPPSTQGTSNSAPAMVTTSAPLPPPGPFINNTFKCPRRWQDLDKRVQDLKRRPDADFAVVSGPGYRGAILPVDAAPLLFCQCSRSSPGLADAYWMPSPVHIAHVEQVLATTYAAKAAHQKVEIWYGPKETGYQPYVGRPRALPKFGRQYLGTVRDSKARIYVNLFFLGADDDEQWLRVPHVVCDGGDANFGVEFDLASETMTHYAVNGG